MDKTCRLYFAKDYISDVYFFEFIVDKYLNLANINNDNLYALWESGRFQNYDKTITECVDEYLICPYLKPCHAGCHKKRINSNQNLLYEGYRIIYQDPFLFSGI
jgi:radical SAM protein with 4Fe4S-binding SPASM domain